MLALSFFLVWLGFPKCPFKTLRITSWVVVVYKLTCDGRVFMPGLHRFPLSGSETCFGCFVPAVEHCFLEYYSGFPEFCFHIVVGLLVVGFVQVGSELVGCGCLVADFHSASEQTNSEAKCDAFYCKSMFSQKGTQRTYDFGLSSKSSA